jgi:hypothetical protein
MMAMCLGFVGCEHPACAASIGTGLDISISLALDSLLLQARYIHSIPSTNSNFSIIHGIFVRERIQ